MIEIRRVTKVTKGGKRLKFRAIVVCGNQKGEAGFGVGKASEVPEAIRKAREKANKNRISISLKGSTISAAVDAKYDASRVILKPATKGHGLVAGKTMRAFLEVFGVRDAVCKVIGSTSAINVLNATYRALKFLELKEKKSVEGL
ncbi:MAG: 30S ribosomal protein S5 [Candidatus Omnitrophica bacterium]|nr:30S ribosomal protein S5 [Candidatus Omnitrophota bacterium]